jgi:hypothetical protein
VNQVYAGSDLAPPKQSPNCDRLPARAEVTEMLGNANSVSLGRSRQYADGGNIRDKVDGDLCHGLG